MSPRVPRARGTSPSEIATRRAVTARDAGLRRISAVTRWLGAGAVALSGALALIAAGAFHGKTLPSTPASSPATTSESPPTASAPSGLQPPAQAPASTAAPAAVVSGGT